MLKYPLDVSLPIVKDRIQQLVYHYKIIDLPTNPDGFFQAFDSGRRAAVMDIINLDECLKFLEDEGVIKINAASHQFKILDLDYFNIPSISYNLNLPFSHCLQQY